METYISILRGINLGGYKGIKMDELKKMYEALNFKNVQTYIQSGNVVFQAAKTNQQELEKSISQKITDTFLFEVPVIVITKKELELYITNNPYLRGESIDSIHLHITFLSTEPTKENRDKIIGGEYQEDKFSIIKKSVYLYCPNGYGNTKLSNTFFEKKLAVSATTRNWKTTIKLLDIANEISKNN